MYAYLFVDDNNNNAEGEKSEAGDRAERRIGRTETRNNNNVDDGGNNDVSLNSEIEGWLSSEHVYAFQFLCAISNIVPIFIDSAAVMRQLMHSES